MSREMGFAYIFIQCSPQGFLKQWKNGNVLVYISEILLSLKKHLNLNTLSKCSLAQTV